MHLCLQFLGACTWQGHFGMLMELLEDGTLSDAIRRPSYAWDPGAMAWALDIVRGLRYLHSRSIAHLDLKSPNVLLR